MGTGTSRGFSLEIEDLDRPMVTGCVYNGTAPPPFSIPAEITRSGLKTRSTPGGDGYNELSFEDAKGREQIRLHAERNLDEMVNLDHSTDIGRDQRIRVGGTQSTTIERAQSVSVMGPRTLFVAGDHSVQTDADHRETIAGSSRAQVRGNRDLHVAGELATAVGADASLHVQGVLSEAVEGSAIRHIGTVDRPSDGEVFAFGDYLVAAAGAVRLRSDQAILLECGDSSIELTPDGIRLRGKDIRTIATKLASMQSSGPQIVATDEIEIAAKSVHVFGETSRLSLTKGAVLTGETTLLTGGGAGLGLAGSATLSGGKVVVDGKGATLVLDGEAKLDGSLVKLNCGGEGGGVSIEERDPKRLVTPKEAKRKPLQLRVLDGYREPMRAKPYVLTVASERFEGTTGDDGVLAVEVLEEASQGKLDVWPEGDFPTGPRLHWSIDIEVLPPANLPLGASIRLSNLAYYRGAPVETIDEELELAIGRFQVDRRLPVTRKLDPLTVLTLMKLHGH